MSTTRFSTADEAKASIAAGLGEFADGFDIDAIFDEVREWHTDVDSAGVQHGNGWFELRGVDIDDWNAILQRHDTSGEE